jgi:hypothetical protein
MWGRKSSNLHIIVQFIPESLAIKIFSQPQVSLVHSNSQKCTTYTLVIEFEEQTVIDRLTNILTFKSDASPQNNMVKRQIEKE